MAEKKQKLITCKVIPLEPSDRKQGFISINTGEFTSARMIVFDRKLYLTEKEYRLLYNMKSITSEKDKPSVEEIMRSYKCNASKAKEIINNLPEMNRIKKPKRFEIIKY